MRDEMSVRRSLVCLSLPSMTSLRASMSCKIVLRSLQIASVELRKVSTQCESEGRGGETEAPLGSLVLPEEEAEERVLRFALRLGNGLRTRTGVFSQPKVGDRGEERGKHTFGKSSRVWSMNLSRLDIHPGRATLPTANVSETESSPSSSETILRRFRRSFRPAASHTKSPAWYLRTVS